jgi:hypothetical protein
MPLRRLNAIMSANGRFALAGAARTPGGHTSSEARSPKPSLKKQVEEAGRSGASTCQPLPNGQLRKTRPRLHSHLQSLMVYVAYVFRSCSEGRTLRYSVARVMHMEEARSECGDNCQQQRLELPPYASLALLSRSPTFVLLVIFQNSTPRLATLHGPSWTLNCAL